MRKPARARGRGIAAAALAALAAITLLWFQPQKLLYDQRVDEVLPGASAAVGTQPTAAQPEQVPAPGLPDPSPATPPPAQPVELAAGSFVSREHETVGTARVLRLPDGQVIVRLERFATSNGPQLIVGLSRNAATGPDAAFDDELVDLGPLKGNIGDQNYAVPAGVDAAGYTSVVVWCDRFDTSFGAADLARTAT